MGDGVVGEVVVVNGGGNLVVEDVVVEVEVVGDGVIEVEVVGDGVIEDVVDVANSDAFGALLTKITDVTMTER